MTNPNRITSDNNEEASNKETEEEDERFKNTQFSTVKISVPSSYHKKGVTTENVIFKNSDID